MGWDPKLAKMTDLELILTARFVAAFLRSTKRDTNPEAVADILAELTYRLERPADPHNNPEAVCNRGGDWEASRREDGGH